MCSLKNLCYIIGRFDDTKSNHSSTNPEELQKNILKNLQGNALSLVQLSEAYCLQNTSSDFIGSIWRDFPLSGNVRWNFQRKKRNNSRTWSLAAAMHQRDVNLCCADYPFRFHGWLVQFWRTPGSGVMVIIWFRMNREQIKRAYYRSDYCAGLKLLHVLFNKCWMMIQGDNRISYTNFTTCNDENMGYLDSDSMKEKTMEPGITKWRERLGHTLSAHAEEAL